MSQAPDQNDVSTALGLLHLTAASPDLLAVIKQEGKV